MQKRFTIDAPRGFVAVDTETFLTAPSVLAPPLVCLTWWNGETGGLLDPEDACDFMRALLASDAVMVGQNFAFDVQVLIAEFPELRPAFVRAYRAGRVRDTMLAEQLLDIAKGSFRFVEVEDELTGEVSKQPINYSLAEIAKRRLGRIVAKGEDTWRLRYAYLADVPVSEWPAEAREYATGDAVVTFDVADDQSRDPAAATLVDEPAQCRAAIALHATSGRGVLVDTAAVDRLERGLLDKRASVRAGLADLGIYRPDGSRDMARLRAHVEAAYEALGQEIPQTSGGKSGKRETSTSGAVLKDSGNPRLVALAELGKVEKLLNAFVPGIRTGAVAPLTCRYNVLVESGRTSCSANRIGKRKGVQLQQLPRIGGVRECIIARPGYVLISVDFDTLELRALAQACLDLVGWSSMAEALRTGADLHLVLAAELLGIGYAEAVRRYEANDPVLIAARQQAKPVNFGYPGGLGPDRFMAFAWQQYEVRFTRREAELARSKWRARFPEVRELQSMVGANIDPARDACDVVQLRSGRLRGRVKYTEACNTFFQGLAADGAKRACFDVWADGAESIFPVAFLHDEILAEAREDEASEAGDLLAKLMVNAMSEVIPDVPITASPALMRRWYKGAKTVRDASGKLIPWEPKAKG